MLTLYIENKWEGCVLTVFLLPAEENKDVRKTIESFITDNLSVKFILVNNIKEINDSKKETPWYGVFYDNEFLEEKLTEALSTFFILEKADILVVFKLIKENALFFPRFYRDWILLKEDLTPLQEGLNHQKILNGWILENKK